MPFCPKCRIEYREGFTTCSGCDVDLVPDLPAETPDSREAARDQEAVPVFVASHNMEAQIVQGVLDAAGIESYLTPDTSRSRMAGSSVDRLMQQTIYVLESDAERAQDVIEQALESGSQE